MIKRYLAPYGWAGLVVIGGGEWLLFSGNGFIGTWMTPVMWTGYILTLDNIVKTRTETSLISSSRAQLPLILLLSIGSWLIFEGYNVYLQNWYYINLPENVWILYAGYAWSFATITPGILLTRDLLRSCHFFSSARTKPFTIRRRLLGGVMGISAVLSLYPLVFPNPYLFPLVWVSFIFLVDPAIYFLGGKSLIKELSDGKADTLLQLLVAGIMCGFLWEFWNYWAVTKWIYTVPYFPEYKLFEMPLVGYVGFPPFAVECYVIYQLFRTLLARAGLFLRYS